MLPRAQGWKPLPTLDYASMEMKWFAESLRIQSRQSNKLEQKEWNGPPLKQKKEK